MERDLVLLPYFLGLEVGRLAMDLVFSAAHDGALGEVADTKDATFSLERFCEWWHGAFVSSHSEVALPLRSASSVLTDESS